jgi:hypothetical protein
VSDGFPLCGGRHHFFEAISLSMALSSIDSAPNLDYPSMTGPGLLLQGVAAGLLGWSRALTLPQQRGAEEPIQYRPHPHWIGWPVEQMIPASLVVSPRFRR